MTDVKPAEINLKFPSFIWPLALITSAVIGVLQVTGVAQVPWWTFLVPILIPIALSLAVLAAIALVGLIVVVVTTIFIVVDDWNIKRKTKRRNKPIKMKVTKR